MIKQNALYRDSLIVASMVTLVLGIDSVAAGVEHIQVFDGMYQLECAATPSQHSPYGSKNVTSDRYLTDENGNIIFDQAGGPVVSARFGSFYKVLDFQLNIPDVVSISIDDPKYNNLLNIEAECVDGKMQPSDDEVVRIKRTLAEICHKGLVAGVETVDSIPGFTLYFGAESDIKDNVGILADGQTGANGINDGCEDFIDEVVENYFVTPLAEASPRVIDYFDVNWETKRFKFFWFNLLYGDQWGEQHTYFVNGEYELRHRRLGWNFARRSFHGNDFPGIMVNCHEPYFRDVDGQYFVKQDDGSVHVHGQAIKATRYFCAVPNPKDPGNRSADISFSFHFHMQQEYNGSN